MGTRSSLLHLTDDGAAICKRPGANGSDEFVHVTADGEVTTAATLEGLELGLPLPLPPRAERGRRGRGNRGRRSSGSRSTFTRDNDLWYRDPEGEEHRLTEDGTSEDPYRGRVYVSPDGAKALAFQVERGERHEVHLIESTPKDQVQPKLHSHSYRKPGDRIDRPRPRLFDLRTKQRIEVDEAPSRTPGRSAGRTGRPTIARSTCCTIDAVTRR